ncbi:MAG TPA: ubiquinol-cytochrome C chaperone family protein [Devosia sp.]|nr:ubiquinol-cytochrome C chaperone family protein [Devosia sp.]
MAFWPFRKSSESEPVLAVYAAIVTQSRQPRFYAEWGVPDTVTGRFDMLSLHLALLLRRLRDETAARGFSQALLDLFLADMDRSLRDLGIGDLSIPKRIKKMNGLFFGLLTRLDAALASGEAAALEDVLIRNIYGGAACPGAGLLAAYVAAETARLAGQSAEAIMAGRIEMGEAA